jgi:DNA recombination protein RmuC
VKNVLTENQRTAFAAQSEKLEGIDRHVMARQEAMNQTVFKQLETMEQRLAKLETMSEQKLEALRQSMQTSMQEMRQENAKKLDEIRGTVDEKLQDTLQKKITESFQTVSQQLEQVYKGLGEMQHLASDVGSLKQVLSGVKTRGILGEVQLGAILEEILAPEQYETNVATIPGSKERVEFAVKLPGSDGEPVYLPIDSKFPGDTYMHLQEAQAAGDREATEEARKALMAVLKKSAKDIRDKYVEPPYTTTFGILFLPFEGLYAEVVNLGMVETLQRDYGINIAGPSTMAALLNSLQMGFRTLAIQKRSNEVWKVLGEVKTEFTKFEDVMLKMQSHLQQTSNDLENLMGTRTRAINRKLRSVQQLDAPESLPEGEE